MKRLEIFANLSVKDDIVRGLETLNGFKYTVVPVVHGKGGDDWKLGTIVWPEENFLLVSYLDDAMVPLARGYLSSLKQRYPHEGITFFTMTVD
jgi:hypothetical protein